MNFPDPKGLNRDLHAMGFKAVWMLDPGIAVVERGNEGGRERGEGGGPSSIADASADRGSGEMGDGNVELNGSAVMVAAISPTAEVSAKNGSPSSTELKSGSNGGAVELRVGSSSSGSSSSSHHTGAVAGGQVREGYEV